MNKQKELETVPHSLTKPCKFSEAYPEVLEISISGDVRFDDYPSKYFNYTISNTPPAYIDCNNLDCDNGGYALHESISDLYKSRITSGEFEGGCTGHHKTRGNAKYPRSCMARFKGKITIKYKEKEA